MLKLILKKLIPFKIRRMMRKVQSSLRRRCSFFLYQLWIFKYNRPNASIIRNHIKEFKYKPTISIIIPVSKTSKKFLNKAIKSVSQQFYPYYELILNEELKSAKGEFIAFMEQDALLSKDALYQVVKTLNQNPDSDILYSDSDYINSLNIRYSPYFKPDWDPYLILGQNYIGYFQVIRRTLLESIVGANTNLNANQNWDLILRLSENTQKFCHLPYILYHSRANNKEISNSGPQIVADHLKRKNIPARVSLLKNYPVNQIHFTLPAELPLISIIIPTKDGLNLLKPCIDSLFKTTKLDFEIVIINNNSEKQETFDYFKEIILNPKIKVLDYPHPFNYAAINNFGVEAAKGQVILLLNNDIEAFEEGWLEEMLSLTLQEDVGIVGAKLYYPNDTIQHAGVILGIDGSARHIETGLPMDAPGYFYHLQLLHCFSAVTAACIMLRKSIYDEIEGFDAERFPVTFNDIDLCIKVRKAGYQVVWTPHAALYHKESATRGEDVTPEKLARTLREAARLKEKWGDDVIQNDPFYNPNLTFKSNDYALAFPPRVD